MTKLHYNSCHTKLEASAMPAHQHDSCKPFLPCVSCGILANRWRDHARLTENVCFPVGFAFFVSAFDHIRFSLPCYFSRGVSMFPTRNTQRRCFASTARLVFVSCSGHADNAGIAARLGSRHIFWALRPTSWRESWASFGCLGEARLDRRLPRLHQVRRGVESVAVQPTLVLVRDSSVYLCYRAVWAEVKRDAHRVPHSLCSLLLRCLRRWRAILSNRFELDVRTEMLSAPTTYQGIPGAEYCQMAVITVPSVFPTITTREGAD